MQFLEAWTHNRLAFEYGQVIQYLCVKTPSHFSSLNEHRDIKTTHNLEFHFLLHYLNATMHCTVHFWLLIPLPTTPMCVASRQICILHEAELSQPHARTETTLHVLCGWFTTPGEAENDDIIPEVLCLYVCATVTWSLMLLAVYTLVVKLVPICVTRLQGIGIRNPNCPTWILLLKGMNWMVFLDGILYFVYKKIIIAEALIIATFWNLLGKKFQQITKFLCNYVWTS